MKPKREVSKDLETLIQAYQKVESENPIFKEALHFLAEHKKNLEKSEPLVSIEIRESTLEKLKVFGSGVKDWDAVLNRILELVPRQAPVSEEDPVKGAANAPVTILEFTDFDCVYCKLVLPAIEDVLEAYEGKVRLVFKNFPRTLKHPDATKAHEAVLCASEQGKFWEYHDALFKRQKKLKHEMLMKIAIEVGLDVERFKICFEAGINTSKIFQDMKEGFEMGVRRVPTFFINGRKLEGNATFSEFKEIIEEELRKV